MAVEPQHKMALEGIKVLDLSRVLAGPWATQTLADMGAEVIKIEQPGSGDDTRKWGPPFLSKANGEPADAAYYLSANRNKKSVTLDITQPNGQEAIRKLAKISHIFVENFKTEGLKKYGLDYNSLKKINPALVYCSVTGFGQTGPYAKRAGYDFLVQGMGGLMSITGAPDDAPSGEPMKVGVATSDLYAGLYAVIGILSALRHAESTGEGQFIDISLLDCQVGLLANQAMNYLVSGKPPKRLGNAHPNVVPYQVFPTSDGHLILAIGNDRQFFAFCATTNLNDLSQDTRYRSNSLRVENRDSLIEKIKPVMLTKKNENWFQIFEKAGVPCGPINNIKEVFENEQVIARNMLINMTGESIGNVQLVANPLKMSLTPPTYRTAPPTLGQHTDEIMDYLSSSDE